MTYEREPPPNESVVENRSKRGGQDENPHSFSFGPNFLHYGEPDPADPSAVNTLDDSAGSANPHSFPRGPNLFHYAESDPDW